VVNIESPAVTLNAKHPDALAAYDVSAWESVYGSALEAYKARVSGSDRSPFSFKFKKVLLVPLNARRVTERGKRLDLFNEFTLE
jgi:hypothetical protein